MNPSDSKAASSQPVAEAFPPPCRSEPPFGRLPFGLTRQQLFVLGSILAATALVYFKSLSNNFVFDDVPEIVQNRLLPTSQFLTASLTHDIWFFRDPSHLPQSNFYRPVQNLWLALNWRLFHYNPAGWHAAKILLHLAVVVLAFRIAQRLAGSVPAALVAAGLFAISPVQVEAVAWITAIPEALAALFMMSAFCLYIGIGQAQPRSHLGFWPLLLYAGAAFTHEGALLFPALIFAYEWLLGEAGPSSVGKTGWNRLREPIARGFRAAIPFAGVALLYLGARVAVFGWSGLDAAHVQALSGWGFHLTGQTADTSHSSADILMSLPSVITEYLALIVLPWLPGPAHPVYFVTAPSMGNFWLPAIILGLVIAGGSWVLWRSSRRNLYAFGIAWWAIMLAPALHLNSLFAIMNDRYEYMPLFGWCLIAGDWSARTLWQGRLPRPAAIIGCAAVAITMTVFSWRGQAAWHDDLTLFSQSVAAAPGSPRLHVVLAKALFEQGAMEDGAGQLRQASLEEPQNKALQQLLEQVNLFIARRREAQQEADALNAVYDILAPWQNRSLNPAASRAGGRSSLGGRPASPGAPY
ncbi:MAG: tetratricopeptide repeat protein [Candidatus Binataceae bacterium]|jgi:hypothetical protein